MPVYATRCFTCGAESAIFRRVALRDENLPACDCGHAMVRVLSAPMLRPDIEPYVSPNGNYMVNSRAQRKEDLARSNAIGWEPGIEAQIASNLQSEKDKAFKPLADAVDKTVANLVASGLLES